VGRYVLGWRLSTLLDVSFCIEALEEVLSKERPEVFEEAMQCAGESPLALIAKQRDNNKVFNPGQDFIP
jgi:hypothetical protein